MATLIEELNPIAVGLDIGQISDPTAIAVVEAMQKHDGRYRALGEERTVGHVGSDGQWVGPRDADPVLSTEYTLRYIRRFPLGTSYPDIAERVAEMLCNPMFYGHPVRVLIDVTGVGRPVYEDILSECALRHECRSMQIKPISFVSGQKYNRSTGTLGKAYLVSRLQSLLQGGRVHAPETEEVLAMLEELKVYEIKVSEDGHDTYGAFKTGTHDDLATALALSVLEDPYADRVTYSKRVY